MHAEESESAADETGHKASSGLLMSQSAVLFDKAEGSQLNLVGTAQGSQRTTLINPNWNFEQMGIGGLDTEFSAIFRRAFASRVFPPDLVKKLGINHVRGKCGVARVCWCVWCIPMTRGTAPGCT